MTAGAMDLEDQWRIKRCVEQYGMDNLVVILGCPDAESAEIQAETVTIGDPSLAGPLAGRPMGLPVYHILEDQVRRLIPPEVFRQCALTKTQDIDAAAISQRMDEVRAKARELLSQD